MRGKLYLGQGILKGRGSIPAHTGGKRRRAWRSKVSQVYPRARGGERFSTDRRAPNGSIPGHAGEIAIDQRPNAAVRSIPALAGNLDEVEEALVRYGLSPPTPGEVRTRTALDA